MSEFLIFSFDVGKASLGICVRQGDNILALSVLLVPPEFASTVEFRSRRRALRTRLAHKKREHWLRQTWRQAGLSPLDSHDEKLKREFPRKGDETLYNSAVLRIALLQEKPLKEWQIYKALWSAIQHRGYDEGCNWNRRDNDDNDTDAKDNMDSVTKYKEDLGYHTNSLPGYQYPCYLEASLMGLWAWESPTMLKSRFESNQPEPEKVRTKGRVAPRDLVEAEVRKLFENAQKQIPALQSIDPNEFLYGPGKKRYASLYQEYACHRGTEWDAQGVLSQKVPRFDNRILNKCQMLPKRNVCKANDPLNIKLTLLMRLLNLRFTDGDGVYNRGLTPEEFPKAYQKAQEILAGKQACEITFTQTGTILEHATGMKVQILNMKGGDKIKINTGGRSRFCRPALKLMIDILLSGQDPKQVDLAPYIQAEIPEKGVTREELESMTSRLGDSWETFHIGDKRYIDLEAALGEGKDAAINKLIGSCNNPVVRHRLTMFWNELKKLEAQHGKPDRVILEFVRGNEGLDGQKTASDWEKSISKNEKDNDLLRKKLIEIGLPATKNNLTRLKLLQEQGGRCPYTGEKLEESQLSSYDIDHIVPVTNEIATDSLYNKVLCLPEANREKGNRTPYEWLKDNSSWAEFLARVTDKNGSYGKRKQQLLTRADSRELVESYNGLAETAYIARLAQQLTALQFGWGLQTKEDDRRVFVNDGKVTATIRRIYGLNELLLSDEDRKKLAESREAGKQREVWKKNRKNDKHHAVDAYCISYSQELKLKNVDDRGVAHFHAPGLERSKAQFERRLLDLFPVSTRRNTKEMYPLETIYGYRSRIENGKTLHYLTVRKNLVELLSKERKKIKDIFDDAIRMDLTQKSQEITDSKEWVAFLEKYRHPQRKSLVKTVILIDARSENPPVPNTEGRLSFGELKDFGNQDNKQGKKGITFKQFKRSKANQGQLIYKNEKNKWCVQQVLVHEKLSSVKEKLIQSKYTLYKEGMLFYSNCLIFIPKPFKAGKLELSGGLYKSRSLKSNGDAKLENSNGEEFLSNIKHLVEAGFELAQYHDKTVKVEPV